jgi:predicted O-methyltransferase YrrM
MALASPEAYIETIEKDQTHSKDAEKFIHEQNLSDRIIVRNEIAELLLPELEPGYDLIFFDGYQIHYEFLPHYERLLKPGGVLILGNNHLTSKTSDKFFEELEHSGKWDILEKFADTMITIKK